ncbi:MAG: cellulase family glycosylhydrolase [Candidatus Nanopelagicales bacterium]
MRRAAAAAAALVISTAAVCSCGPGPGLPADLVAPGSPGVSTGYEILELTDADLQRELTVYRDAGARWLRVDLDWPAVEPSPGAWAWDAPDRVVTAAQEAGLEVLLVPTKSPDWARARGRPQPAAFARFMESAVQRYGPRGVRAWEIWNEENTSTFWQSPPDPAHYVRLLSDAYRIVHAAYPDAWVVFGGLAPAVDDPQGRWLSPTTFLQRAYAAGAQGRFDAIGVHPYSYPATPSQSALPVRHGYRDLEGVRRALDDHGDQQVPVWVTEVGAPTGSAPRAVSPATQARIVTEAFEYARSHPGMGPVFVYSGRDRGVDPGDPELNFGMVDRDFRPKPALEAFRSQAARAPRRARRVRPRTGRCRSLMRSPRRPR